MVVIAAAQDACVPADKATAVRAALTYVPSRLGLIGGCICAWILPGQAVQDGLCQDLSLGSVDVRGPNLSLQCWINPATVLLMVFTSNLKDLGVIQGLAIILFLTVIHTIFFTITGATYATVVYLWMWNI